MQRSGSGPLTDADYRKINQQLMELEHAYQEGQRAVAAGFPCDPEVAMCKELQDRLAAIKKAYFPERP